MACAAVSMAPRSKPNTLIATSPRVPVSISETRISMGWVKPYTTPGKRSMTRRMAVAMSSLLPRHWSFGRSTRKVSVSLSPIGSRPRSSEPERATIERISGTSASSACCTRRSRSTEVASETDGAFCNCTIMSPSSMVGMKVLPTDR